MTKEEQKDILFDALLRISVSDALKNEMASLPTNEELNAGFIPSAKLDKRITKIILQNKRKSKRRLYSKRISKLAATIVIIAGISSITLLSVEATRKAIFNAFVEKNNQYTEIKFQEADTEGEQMDIYRPTYLPKGYEEVSIQSYGSTVMLIYSNDEMNEIHFMQRYGIEGSAFFDNEDNKYTETEIAGNKAYLFEATTEEVHNILLWRDESVIFELTSQISIDELTKIANSITKKIVK